MDKNYLIQLTNNLYRLTLLFPKKEPLRYKMRELADDILAKFAEAGPPQIEGELGVLDSFFEVAKAQNWVSPQNILNIQQEYSKLKEIPKQERIENGSLSASVLNGKSGMDERQEKILSFLKENGRAQVWQVKQILPEVTKRTLRRDFESLLEQGTIERMGERNGTFYQLKG